MQCRGKHSKSFCCHFPLREGGGLNNSGISHKHIFMIPFRFGKHLDKGAINTFYSGTFQKYHICYSRQMMLQFCHWQKSKKKYFSSFKSSTIFLPGSQLLQLAQIAGSDALTLDKVWMRNILLVVNATQESNDRDNSLTNKVKCDNSSPFS